MAVFSSFLNLTSFGDIHPLLFVPSVFDRISDLAQQSFWELVCEQHLRSLC